MDTYIDRLYQERSELRDRISKLEDFLLGDTSPVSAVQLTIMDIQRSAMKTYYDCLESRIDWIERAQGEVSGRG